MDEVQRFIEKYKSRIQSHYFNAPEVREEMDSILLDFMMEIVEPFSSFKHDFIKVLFSKKKPPKSKFMEEWDDSEGKIIKDWDKLSSAEQNIFGNLVQLIDKHKEDKGE